jgi:Ca2+-binding RTX toxin-like protein
MATITGTENNDNLLGSSVNDEIEGLAGNDVLDGGGGNDKIEGGDGLDVLIGGDGNDFLEGNKGNDIMIGNAGNDVLEWDDGDGSDLMIGGSGEDTIVVDGAIAAGDEFVLQQQGTQAIFDRVNLVPFKLTVESSETFEVNGEGGNDSFTVGDLSLTEVKQVNFSGGDGNDTLDASASSTPIQARGGRGDDSLTGSSVDDVLRGGSGNDFIQGEKGNDTMIGGAGDDVLVWDDGDGSDRISGGKGNDLVGVKGSVSQGDEFTLNQEGSTAIFDRVNLVPFKLTVDTSETFAIQGEVGDDSLVVNDLSQTTVELVQFSGGQGNDILNGSGTSTSLVASGDEGNDTLIGGYANDSLTGGIENDVLNGRGGDDLLTGGSGSDNFVFSSGAPFSAAALGVDTITDFSAAEGDRIVLDRTTFGQIGAADIQIVADDTAASLNAGLITYSLGTGNLFFNQNGADVGLGSGDRIATLTGTPILAAGDFAIVPSFTA